MPAVVTLTTDFEERDPYAASTKGVVCAKCPGVHVVDLSHQIPRQNVPEGALFIAGAIPFFPKGTVHLVAVASGPQPIIVTLDGQHIVCPDNGVVTMLAEQHPIQEVHAITHPDLQPNTEGQIYYGRDVFAPAAAMLAGGTTPAELGEALDHAAMLDLPKPVRDSKRLVIGQIVHVNRFGTLVTNVHESFLEGAGVKNVEVGDFSVGGLSKSYTEVPHGSPLALFGSAGYLEIAYNGDRAATRLDMGNGIRVNVFTETK